LRLGILEPCLFSEKTEKFLKSFLEIEKYDNGSLGLFLKNLDILFVRLKFKIDERFLSQAPNLKIICSPTTGLTHIDENALKLRGIRLVSLQGELKFLKKITSTAEHTVGLIIANSKSMLGARGVFWHGSRGKNRRNYWSRTSGYTSCSNFDVLRLQDPIL
jgi:D-3-phosphoglycerate dehydrogenase